MAPSTLGTFLRAFTFGHVRQLDAVIAETIRRAWSLGAGPGDDADDDRPGLDDLRGARQAQTGRRLRLHQGARLPPAPRHLGRHRRGAARPAAQRVLPAGRTSASSKSSSPGCAGPGRAGRSSLRADSGFFSYALIDTLRAPRGGLVDHGHHQRPGQGLHRRRSTSRPGSTITYPDGGRGPGGRDDLRDRGREASERELAPRRAPHPAHRSRPTSAVARLASPRLHHRPRPATRSRPTGSTATTPASSSPSATSKKAPGSSTAPRASFFANAAWLACAVLAHNLIRWTARLGDIHPDDQLTVARTVRTRVLALPGRLVNRSGRHRAAAPRALAVGDHLHPAPSSGSARCRSSPEAPTPRTGAAADALHALTIDTRTRAPLGPCTPFTTVRRLHPDYDQRTTTSAIVMAENRWIEA